MCVCALLMNEGLWSSDTDLQNEAGSTRVPDQNQNQHQIRMLKEEEEEVQGGSGCLRHSLHHDFSNNNGEEVEEDEEGDGGSKMEEEDEEMDSTSGACSPELIRDSSSLSCSPTVCEGPLSPEEIPVGVFSPHGLSCCVSESLRVLEERGDDAALPHRLHQIAECLVQEEDYERAVHLLQLERLYHERVLSNIAALQEAWVNRWRCSRSFDNSLPHCNLNSEHLNKLKHICLTHRQPSWSSDTCELVHGISVNGESCGEKNTTSESPCIDKSEMLEQDEVSPSERVTACLAQQREPTQLCDSASSTPTSSLQTPPTLVMTETSSPATIREEAEKQSERKNKKEQEKEWSPQETGKETESKGSGSKVEPGRGRMEAEPERDGVGVDTVKSAPKTEEVMKEGGVETVPLTQLNKGAEKQEEEVELEEEQEEEAVEGLELEEELQRPEDAILDDLAKRIQVEEIAPASGLVSILKRRVCDGADDASSTSKPLTKRRVRFHFPEDGLEQDEVGGDSWLLLLLLCLVTVVISVGGTALYCAFGNDNSSVCTDFSHNVDFYMGKVQRSVDDITHFFSSSSS
ncbi:consortin [Clarias gariepinus]|uniref:consortin n=1 Tax=Clarias gariepinus TaxID=13013 RepID=UPI00234E0D0F|nr:consortin [Clarias gariepinus]